MHGRDAGGGGNFLRSGDFLVWVASKRTFPRLRPAPRTNCAKRKRRGTSFVPSFVGAGRASGMTALRLGALLLGRADARIKSETPGKPETRINLKL